jgi:hypothetical protein
MHNNPFFYWEKKKSDPNNIFVNKNPTYLKDSYLWSPCKEVVDHFQKLQYETCGSFNFMSTSTLWD